MLLSTQSIAAPHRLQYWRDIVCDTFVELECSARDEGRFYGSLESRDFGDIRFTRVGSTAQRVARTRTRIARSQFDHILLSLQLCGQGVHKQDGRVAHLRPGDFVLYDTTRPYELLFADPFTQLVLTLPRKSVRSRLADLQRLTACTVQGQSGSGRLASLFIRQLAGQIAVLGGASVTRLHTSVIDLIATAVAEQRLDAYRHLAQQRNVLTQRVLQYIEDHLGDTELSCRSIAERHRISERYLRSLFEDFGTCASDWLWARRLERARVDLADPRLRSVSTKTIGFNWGFKDAAHFSRAYKKKFGCPPSEARIAAGDTPAAP